MSAAGHVFDTPEAAELMGSVKNAVYRPHKCLHKSYLSWVSYILLLLPAFGPISTTDGAVAFPISEYGTSRTVSVSGAISLLYQYGYLGNDNKNGNPKNPMYRSISPLEVPSETSLTLPPPGFKEGLRKFQRQFGLAPTGRLNQETMQLLTSSRCGNPDNLDDHNEIGVANRLVKKVSNPHTEIGSLLKRIKRFAIGDERMRWNKKKLTWQIRSYPSKTIDRRQTHAVFQYAFNLWSKEINLDFEEETDYYKPADIVIQFGAGKHGDSIPFDGPGGVLAHAHYPTPDNVYSLSGDAHFDDDETWSDGPHNENRNLVSVAAHELGHSLGLGHSNVPTAVMYPFYITAWKEVKLDDDDIKGMRHIYGAAPPGKVLPTQPHLPDVSPPPPTTPVPDKKKMFDFCNVSVDAIIKIRNLDLYIFKGEWQWRVTWSTTVSTWVSYQFRDGPAKIIYYWPALPEYLNRIDAGIERYDGAIYMFRDRNFWLLNDNVRLKSGIPPDGLPLTYLGLPSTVDRIDTVFRWAENNAIYLFAGQLYWMFDERYAPFGRVLDEPDYPRDIRVMWRGVPVPTQVAFTGLDGETLFFTGTQYYAYDNIKLAVRPGYPKQASLSLLGCTQT